MWDIKIKERFPIVRKREGHIRLARDIRIEVLLSSGMIVKQKKERRLVKGFSSGMIPKEVRKNHSCQ